MYRIENISSGNYRLSINVLTQVWRHCKRAIAVFSICVFSLYHVSAQDFATWSLEVEGGAMLGQWVPLHEFSEGLGTHAGFNLAKMFNPWWGLSADYALQRYVGMGTSGIAHEFAGIGSANLSNVLAPYRNARWLRLNVYLHLGAGIAFFETFDDVAQKTVGGRHELTLPLGVSMELALGESVNLVLAGDHRRHTSNMRLSSERSVMWSASLGVLVKFGKKRHVRDVSVNEYFNARFPEKNDELKRANERIDQLEQRLNTLNEQAATTNKPATLRQEQLRQAQLRQAQLRQAQLTQEQTNDDELHIDFREGSYDIDVNLAQPTLKYLETMMNMNPKVRIVVTGYIDGSSNEYSRQILSLYRANAVKDYLVKRGINAERIATSGKASKQPRTTVTAAELQKNRRADIQILLK